MSDSLLLARRAWSKKQGFFAQQARHLRRRGTSLCLTGPVHGCFMPRGRMAVPWETSYAIHSGCCLKILKPENFALNPTGRRATYCVVICLACSERVLSMAFSSMVKGSSGL
jgi:hypothetical protein